jgi:capsular polysaccharide biosynthesis protein
VKNKIDLSQEPDALFLNPWADEGLKLLTPLSFLWRAMPSAVISGFAVSTHPEINQRIRAFVDATRRHRMFDRAVEVNTVPVVIDRASFRKAALMASGKLVLSGASGTRLLNTYRWENEAAEFDAGEKLAAYFADCQTANEGAVLPLEKTFLENDVHFAIECRNTFNFYHFMVESLSQITVLDLVGFQGNIYFHYPNPEEKRRPFAEAFVEALFPEYAGRVFFERAPKEYNVVLTAFDMTIALGQAPAEQTRGLTKLLRATGEENPDLGDADVQTVFAMNAVSTALLALRARALKAIEGHDFSYLPKRFFVGRDDRSSRSRPTDGDDALFAQLQEAGFEWVVFEGLTPLEQVAIMAQAEVMVSCHGAGFTNMLFAHPDAFVIELGTLQTARYRWKDFWPLAHAAQCRYVSFFADFNAEDPLREPKFDEDGIVPVSLSPEAIFQITAFIAAVLDYEPDMPDALTLHQLGRRVLRAGAGDQAVMLLEAHADLVSADVDLCLLLADCHKNLGETKSELVALERAYRADMTRWQTLVRIFWCASHCDSPEMVRWALTVLEQEFPDRYETFASNHEWVRFVA